MRPRIKTRIDVQSVINSIEHRVGVYSECIKDIMQSQNLEYQQAKRLITLQSTERRLFKN